MTSRTSSIAVRRRGMHMESKAKSAQIRDALGLDAVAIGQRTRDLRRARGLKKSELADNIHYCVETIYTIETGKSRQPSLCSMAMIAQVLNVSLDYLLGLQLSGPEALAKENDALRQENARLMTELKAAEKDMTDVLNCNICGWRDENGTCHKDRRAQKWPCFQWHGAKKLRLWEV